MNIERTLKRGKILCGNEHISEQVIHFEINLPNEWPYPLTGVLRTLLGSYKKLLFSGS